MVTTTENRERNASKGADSNAGNVTPVTRSFLSALNKNADPVADGVKGGGIQPNASRRQRVQKRKLRSIPSIPRGELAMTTGQKLGISHSIPVRLPPELVILN